MTKHGCPYCELYDLSRGDRIRAEIAKTSSNGAEAKERWRRFLAGVHERHAGITLGKVAALMAIVQEETR